MKIRFWIGYNIYNLKKSCNLSEKMPKIQRKIDKNIHKIYKIAQIQKRPNRKKCQKTEKLQLCNIYFVTFLLKSLAILYIKMHFCQLDATILYAYTTIGGFEIMLLAALRNKA